MIEAQHLTVRLAKLFDMPACAKILNDWIDATDWMPRMHPHKDVERHYGEDVFPNRTVYFAENQDREAAGFLALSDSGYITAFYIAQKFRNAGLGSRLLGVAKAIYPQELKLWTFVANRNAQRFYQREGFHEELRTAGDNEEGLADILYVWLPQKGGTAA
ncbi:GNAT family N-acetyltransferase [Roseibium algae]|uniref:GNAT family N-acetyltransferase n=1 Tax=Roseibium algae TaxID=3123038 RepID=A0ABU8TP24_9HYPH